MSEYSTFKGEKEEAKAYCYFFRCTTKSLPFPLLNHDLCYYFPVPGPPVCPNPLTQKNCPTLSSFPGEMADFRSGIKQGGGQFECSEDCAVGSQGKNKKHGLCDRDGQKDPRQQAKKGGAVKPVTRRARTSSQLTSRRARALVPVTEDFCQIRRAWDLEHTGTGCQIRRAQVFLAHTR